MTSFKTNTYSIKSEGKSFYWASFFLPKKNRIAASRLYSICRYLDDVADNSKLDTSSQIKNIFNQIKENESSEINIFFKKNNINLGILKDLIDGLISDQQNVRVTDEKELINYSYRVAGTVGLMMLPIINTNNTEARKHAIDLGIAMQLTNIARDVIEDEKQNRKYIDNNFIKIKETIKLADIFYNSSFKSIREIPLSCRFAILVARRVYRQIGKEILKKRDFEDYKKSGKIFVSNFGKIKQTLLSVYDLILLIFLQTDKYNINIHHNEIKEEINLNERF